MDFDSIARFLIIAAVVVLIVRACATEKEKNKVTNVQAVSVVDVATRFGYNGHDYIMFQQHSKCGVVHDPDCHCQSQVLK